MKVFVFYIMHWSIPVHSLLGISQSFAHTLGASLNPPYGSSLTCGREGKFTCTRYCPAFILIEYPGAFDQLFNIYPPPLQGVFCEIGLGGEGEGFGHYETCSMHVKASVKCFQWRVLLKIQYLPPLLPPPSPRHVCLIVEHTCTAPSGCNFFNMIRKISFHSNRKV